MKINIKGSIVSSNDKWIYDWFEMEAVCPSDVNKLIDEAKGEKLEVEINSGGGDIFAGSEIYTALKNYKGDMQINVVGLAASAASIIAMAGNCSMSPTSMMMIHNVSGGSCGDYRGMEHTAEILKTANKALCSAYVQKTGMAETELLDMMNKETWLSAQQALDLKLVDNIMFENKLDLVASFGMSNMLSREVIEKIRNTVKNPLSNEETQKDTDIFINKIKIERMRY